MVSASESSCPLAVFALKSPFSPLDDGLDSFLRASEDGDLDFDAAAGEWRSAGGLRTG